MSTACLNGHKGSVVLCQVLTVSLQMALKGTRVDLVLLHSKKVREYHSFVTQEEEEGNGKQCGYGPVLR